MSETILSQRTSRCLLVARNAYVDIAKGPEYFEQHRYLTEGLREAEPGSEVEECFLRIMVHQSGRCFKCLCNKHLAPQCPLSPAEVHARAPSGCNLHLARFAALLLVHFQS